MIHKDKIKHLVFSFLLTLIIYWLSQNLIIALLATLLFGLAKELFDQIKRKNTIKESAGDLAANIFGIVLSVALIYLVNLK